MNLIIKAEPVLPESNSMRIVSVQADDWEKYKQIRLEALKTDPSAFGRSYEEAARRTDEQWKDQTIENTEKPHERKLFLALQAETPVGCVGGFRRTDGVWVLNAVYVSPAFRGKGISKRLMQTVLENIQAEPEATVIELTVNVERIPAVKLYQRYGFVIIQTLPDQKLGDGNTHDEYLMRKG